jgi:hypothetical protein
MDDFEYTEAQRKALAAKNLLENEIFKDLVREMELALLDQMKLIPPDSDKFVAYGRHLHALGDIQDYIYQYVNDGVTAEMWLSQRNALN